MIIERNGVVFFSEDQDYKNHAAYRELSKVSLGDVKLPSGFFLVDEDGKTVVVPASEEDRRKMILKAFPDTSEEAIRTFCIVDGGRCRGDCSGMVPRHQCRRAYEESRRQYACACVVWPPQ
jgi:hypothetical protein